MIQLLYHWDSLEYGQASWNAYNAACVKTPTGPCLSAAKTKPQHKTNAQEGN
jgi:hypothetical protein